VKIAIYVRVSTQEQARDGYSIQEQIESLQLYCKAMKWIVVKTYVDAGHSGANMDRPALQDMMRDIEKGLIDKVLVYKLDRLSRSQKDTLELIEDVFLKNKTEFVSMNENFDTSSSFGRAMVGILAVFAQLEREQIKERMSMGKLGRAKDGKWSGGGYVPVGYDYVDGELIINDYEAMQIREIHELYQKGFNFTQIDKIFAEKGYKQKHGGWHKRRIKDVMLNNLYLGYIKFDGETFKGNHEPIISQETFDKSKKIYESKDYSNTKHHGSSSYLGGLIFCKCCTARYTLTSYKDDKKVYKYYACHSRRKVTRSMIKDPNCKNKIYRMEALDSIILDAIGLLASDPKHIIDIKKSNLTTDDIDKEKLIKKEIEKIDAQRSRLRELFSLGEFTMEEIQADIVPLNEQKQKLIHELNVLSQGKASMTVEEVTEIVSKFHDVLKRGVYEEIRLIIDSLVDHLEIDGEDVDIHWKFA
jgi:site-specific DNA recombinase